MKQDIGFWVKKAACTGNSYLFYPSDGERPLSRDKRERKAKSICFNCSVMQECRDYARVNSEFGIWGGENEEDRYLAGYNLPRYSGVTINRRMRQLAKQNNKTKLMASSSVGRAADC